RFVTTGSAIEGGVNAVAKTGDGGIYNVSGILAASKELHLAILRVDAKKVPFVGLNKNANLPVGPRYVVVGSALAGNDVIARHMPHNQANPNAANSRCPRASLSARGLAGRRFGNGSLPFIFSCKWKRNECPSR